MFLKDTDRDISDKEFEDFCKQGTEKQFDENKHLNEQTRFIYNKLKKLL